jgi:PHP family Zn ribbon phosphoesterase
VCGCRAGCGFSSRPKSAPSTNARRRAQGAQPRLRPSFEAVERLNAKLAKFGNLASDGRPILGLDSRLLLEMVLETDPLAFLVPAHIWTPWFSLFGSKSGFDSIEECFGSLAKEIFALETACPRTRK